MYLEAINSPADIKRLSVEQLRTLSDEVRAALIKKLSEHGGHIGPNLGMVEATVALHYVFDSPVDKMVYDVSHQSYPHKMLTGRKDAFLQPEHYDDVTGYTNPLESEHDMFTIGHTSTSVSLASGLAVGRDRNHGKENIIAIIGDGSLSGGEALEALDFAGDYPNNLIILVNDNDQSIAENHGGLYKSLRALRESNGKSENNIFKSFGLDYRYLEEGNDVAKLVAFFAAAKDIDHPIVLHIHTVKGKGLPYAEKEREKWHAGSPFHVEDGSRDTDGMARDTTIFDSLKELLDSNEKAVVLNAATPGGLGFVGTVREAYAARGQFIDVGIAEENAMAMISGIAKNGGTPVFGTFAPFLQRTYDQLSHDLCLNDNPAVVLNLSPGVYGMSSNTHIALCDIQFYAHVPNLIYLAPASREEYRAMFSYATTQKEHPVAIRVPAGMRSSGVMDETDYRLTNKARLVKKGSRVAILAIGNLLSMAEQVAEEVKKDCGVEISVINPRFLSGVDTELLESLKADHHLMLTLEDGELDGGYGQRIAGFYGDSDMRVKCYGISKAFHTDFKPAEILREHGMSVEQLVKVVKENL